MMVSSKGNGNIISLSRAKSYVGRKAKPGNAFFELIIKEINYHQSGETRRESADMMRIVLLKIHGPSLEASAAEVVASDR
jgi:hypothetical protein